MKILPNPQENTGVCLRPLFLLKKRLRQKCFLVNFAKFLRELFLRIPPVAASGSGIAKYFKGGVLKRSVLKLVRNGDIIYLDEEARRNEQK